MGKPKKDNLLVLWHQNDYAELLKTVFGAENIVTSRDHLNRVDFAKSNYVGIVLPVELCWDDNKYSNFFGIELVKTIIRAEKKLRLPILFLSFLSLSQLRLDKTGKEILERQIVGAIGHDFMPLPSAPPQWIEKIRSMEPLNDLQFIDVVNNYCALRGLISGVIHQIRNQFNILIATEANPRPAIKEIFEKGLDEILNLLGKTPELLEARHRILENFDKHLQTDVHSVQIDLSQCEEEFNSLVIEEGEPGSVAIRDKILPWKALILDDDPEGLLQVVDALEKRGIRIVVTRSISEAEKMIEDDLFNEIVVAISDYRLLERIDGISKHQRKQGYDFIFELAVQDRFTHLIALSGLSRRFLLESFQRYNTRVEVYSKNDLDQRMSGAINIFADNVLERGVEVYEALCSRPVGAGWRALKPFYIAYRQSHDYRLNEKEISERARRYVQKIEGIRKTKNVELWLNPSLEELENLSANLSGKNPYKDSESLQIFRNKLIARRIALWLHFCLDFKRIGIYAALRGRLDVDGLLQEVRNEEREKADTKDPNWMVKVEEEVNKKLKQRIGDLLNTNLALSLQEFPVGVLVEEKKWFKYDMGVNIYDRMKIMEQVHYFVQMGVEKWCEVNPSLARKLSKQIDLFTEEGKPNINSIGDAELILSEIKKVLSTNKLKGQYQGLLFSIINNIQANNDGDKDTDEFVEGISALLDINTKVH